MGLFGGSSSSSFSETTQQDQRVIAEEAEILAGAGSAVTVAYPESVAVGWQASVGDITIQPYSPEVRQTVSELIESVNLVSLETIPSLVESFGTLIARTSETFGEAISETSETSMKVTELLGEKLQETQLGQASILPGMAKYLAIAVVVIVVARKVWK